MAFVKHKEKVSDPGFYRSVLILALPIALQNIITLAVNMADTLMLGRADSTGLLLSASSLANQPFTLMSTLCFGLAGGTSVLCTQYYGRGETSAIRTIFAMVLKCAIALSAAFEAVVLIFPEWVMSLFTNNAATIEKGAEYLSVVGWAYVFYGISYTLQCMLRTVAKVNISFVTSLISISFNICGNYALIYGNFGFPALGIKGAAIATLIARIVEFLIMCVYTFAIEKDVAFKVRHILLHNGTLFRDLVHYGAPVLLNEGAWSLAMATQASIIGHIDYAVGDPVSANAINDTVSQIAILGVWGVAAGAAVLVGAAIGEGDIKKARSRANKFQYLGIALGLAATVIIMLLRDPILAIYDLESATHDLAREMMTVTALVQVFVAMSAIAIVGTLRSAGDTVFCFLAETATLWLISIPIAYVVSSVFKLSATIVIFVMKSSEILKAALCHIRVVRGKFIKNVTRTTEEISL